MKNGVNEYPTITYAVPIDSVEHLTGLDFFPRWTMRKKRSWKRSAILKPYHPAYPPSAKWNP